MRELVRRARQGDADAFTELIQLQMEKSQILDVKESTVQTRLARARSHGERISDRIRGTGI